jgi:hypothetical protein
MAAFVPKSSTQQHYLDVLNVVKHTTGRCFLQVTDTTDDGVLIGSVQQASGDACDKTLHYKAA